MNELDIHLGGVTLTDYTDPPPGSWRAYLRDIDGWDTPADDTTDTEPHWSGAGQTPGSPRTAARQIMIGIDIRSSQHGMNLIHEAAQAVTAARLTLTVAEPARGLTRCADTRLIGMQQSRISPWTHRLTLSLTADDPLRYSADHLSLVNGTLLLPNRGNRIAFPRLALVGAHGGLSISHPGGTWTLPAIGSGVVREIVWRERQVFDGAGARVFGAGSGPVPRVLPGGSTWTISGLGAGSAVLSRVEAWS